MHWDQRKCNEIEPASRFYDDEKKNRSVEYGPLRWIHSKSRGPFDLLSRYDLLPIWLRVNTIVFHIPPCSSDIQFELIWFLFDGYIFICLKYVLQRLLFATKLKHFPLYKKLDFFPLLLKIFIYLHGKMHIFFLKQFDWLI